MALPFGAGEEGLVSTGPRIEEGFHDCRLKQTLRRMACTSRNSMRPETRTALTCEGCGKTIEIAPDEVPAYKGAIDAGWRLEYHAPETERAAPRISAKCEICRTRAIRRPDFIPEEEQRERAE